ncbi:MAG: ROK family protein [Actinomycetota bacterium]|nr:ROK family protein [Actinomycetota bacterium]
MASLKELRELNRLRLLEALRQGGAADRAELVRQTGLSRATVSALVSECMSRGVIVEDGERTGAARGGRRSARLRLDPSAGTVLGVDFGHRHVRVALADLASTVLAERRVDLDVDASPATALDTASELASTVLAEARIDRKRVLGAGMGLPGPIDHRTGTVVGSSSILAQWTGLQPADELSRRLELPVRLDNDANLGALGEFVHGAGRYATDIVYVKISAGVGAGLVLDGCLQTGASGIAGELGHVVVVPGGALCRCGNRGCLETVASSTALLRRLEPAHGAGLTTQHLLELAESGNREVTSALTAAGAFVGRALAALTTALNPEVIVVGGDLGAASEVLLDAIRTELRRAALPGAGRLPVRAAILADRAEALGAIALALSEPDWLRRSGLIALNGAAAGASQMPAAKRSTA